MPLGGAVATSTVRATPSARPSGAARIRALEPLGERAGGTAARLGQQQPEVSAPDPDGSIGLARLGADDIADREREALDRRLGRTARSDSTSRTDAGRP